MSTNVVLIMSLSLLIAGVIGLFRYKNMDQAYLPFFYFIEIGCINEILSFILVKNHHHTVINNNIYSLMEALIVTWLFKKFGIFKHAKSLYIFILLSFIISWFLQMSFLNNSDKMYLYFRIYYSIIIVFMSIHTINSILLSETKNLLKNPVFMICAVFVIYFTFSAIIFTFWLIGLSKSMEFTKLLIAILQVINLLCNLIYAIVFLWIPRPRPSVLLSL
jgi:hypothetical protein